VKQIDLLVGTHPHSDHIGQMDKVIRNFDVKEVWMRGEHTSQVFERVIDALLASDKTSFHEPSAGESFNIGSLNIKVIHPEKLTGDLNDDSIAMKFSYGEIDIIITGDAEANGEKAILNRGFDIDAEILRLGHHGSSTSSTTSFLETVSPEVAVYSAGTNNSYGHPHEEIVDRVKNMEIEPYGTDTHGNIILKTDGKTYDITTKKTGNMATNQPIQSQQPVQVERPKNEQTQQSTEDCPPGSIRINFATLEELEQIHLIGEERAAQIIELRKQRHFTSYKDMTRIKGIGNVNYKEIEAEGKVCFE
jgi:DNA uptake protein ComE-like DNA-binding protein